MAAQLIFPTTSISPPPFFFTPQDTNQFKHTELA